MASKNVKNFEFKLGKQALALFIFGMSLLLLGVFIFGVMVGKHVDAYPEMVSGGIPDLLGKKLGMGKEKKQIDPALQDQVEEPADGGEGEFDLTFYETLTKKRSGGPADPQHKKPGLEQAKAAAVAAPGVVAGGLPGNRSPVGSEKKTAADGAAEMHQPPGERAAADAKEKKSIPIGDAQADGGDAETTGKGYIVHVASFRDKGKADRLAKKIIAQGHAAGVQMREVAGKGTWFRVVMNGFKTREEARRALDAVGAKIKGLKATILTVDRKKD